MQVSSRFQPADINTPHRMRRDPGAGHRLNRVVARPARRVCPHPSPVRADRRGETRPLSQRQLSPAGPKSRIACSRKRAQTLPATCVDDPPRRHRPKSAVRCGRRRQPSPTSERRLLTFRTTFSPALNERALRRRLDHPDRRRWASAATERIHHPARLWSMAAWSACACSSQDPQSRPRRPAGAAHTDSYLQYISRSPGITQAWVSVCAASIVVGVLGAVRLAGLRWRACRCSRGHRPSGCGTEARDRRATLPQRHRRGVGGSLTQTPLRRAYRLQRPCSLPIVRAYFGSA